MDEHDAWPMIQRCKQHQWEGLPLWEKHLIDACWSDGNVPPTYRALSYPLWWTGGGLVLMSLKEIPQ